MIMFISDHGLSLSFLPLLSPWRRPTRTRRPCDYAAHSGTPVLLALASPTRPAKLWIACPLQPNAEEPRRMTCCAVATPQLRWKRRKVGSSTGSDRSVSELFKRFRMPPICGSRQHAGGSGSSKQRSVDRRIDDDGARRVEGSSSALTTHLPYLQQPHGQSQVVQLGLTRSDRPSVGPSRAYRHGRFRASGA